MTYVNQTCTMFLSNCQVRALEKAIKAEKEAVVKQLIAFFEKRGSTPKERESGYRKARRFLSSVFRPCDWSGLVDSCSVVVEDSLTPTGHDIHTPQISSVCLSKVVPSFVCTSGNVRLKMGIPSPALFGKGRLEVQKHPTKGIPGRPLQESAQNQNNWMLSLATQDQACDRHFGTEV